MHTNDLFEILEREVKDFTDNLSSNDLFHMNNYNSTENDNEYKITFKLPGADIEDISIRVEGTILKLNVNGNDMIKKTVESIWCPPNVSIESIKATYKNGVLLLTLPKLKESNREFIEITE